MLDPQVSRRTLLRALGLGGVATAVGTSTACGGGDDESTDGSSKTITWWDYAIDPAPFEAMFAKYKAEKPDVTINRRSVPYADIKRILLQSAGAGDLPDIVLINSPDHQQFAELGIAADLTDRVAQWGQKDLYIEGAWQSAMWKDRDYGVPVNVNCLALWYDQDLFEEKKLTPPKNWTELVSVGRALTASPRYGLAFSAPNDQQAVFQWLPTLWQAGGDLDDLGGQPAKRALQLWVDLVHDGIVSREALNWAQADVGSEFANRRAAMMINGPWMIPQVKKEAPDLHWTIAPLPQDAEAASCLGGENYMIVNGPNVDLAWDLLSWTQKSDNLKGYLTASGNLPTRSDMSGDPAWANDPVSKAFVDQLQVARPRAYGSKYPQIADAMVQAIQHAVSGTDSVDAALQAAASTVKPLLPQ